MADETSVPLASVLETLIDHRGRTPKKLGGDFSHSGIPVISAKNIKDGRLDLDTDVRYVAREMFERWMPEKLRAGDVLLTSEAPLGEAAYLTTEVDYCLGQRLFALRADRTRLDPRFLYYLLRSLTMRRRLLARATGTTAQGIRQAELVKVQIDLPPLQEQRAAGELLGALDDKIELNRRMNRTLEATARAIFKSWFVDFDPVRAKMEGRDPPGMDAKTASLFPDSLQDTSLGPLPIMWNIQRLSDLCSTQYGFTASASSSGVGPKFLRVTDINKQPWIEWHSVPHCAISESDFSKYALQPGDIVVARMADPGKAAIIDRPVDAVFASYLVRLRTASLAHAHLVYRFLRSRAYDEYAQGAMGGSVQRNMNARVIVGAQLGVPPVPLLNAYLKHVHPLRQCISRNLQESVTLAELRDALLPRLISGEVRVPG